MAGEAWQPAAHMLAAIFNTNRDPKMRPHGPGDFDRYGAYPPQIIKKRPISALREAMFPGLADNPLLKQLDEAKANDAKRVST